MAPTLSHSGTSLVVPDFKNESFIQKQSDQPQEQEPTQEEAQEEEKEEQPTMTTATMHSTMCGSQKVANIFD